MAQGQISMKCAVRNTDQRSGRFHDGRGVSWGNPMTFCDGSVLILKRLVQDGIFEAHFGAKVWTVHLATFFFLRHRACTALRAASERSSGVMAPFFASAPMRAIALMRLGLSFLARALPPLD
jgi:hypothetical protein